MREGYIIILRAFEVLQFPKILHLVEIFFDFRAQFVGIYDLPCCPAGICRYKYEILVCFLIMYYAGIDWHILLWFTTFP